MKNYYKMTALCLVLATNWNAAEAGMFDQLKDTAKSKAAKAIADKASESQKSDNSSNKAAKSQSSQLDSGPSDTLKSFTQCLDFKPSNIITGYREDYTFRQGMSTEKRSGLIKREQASLRDGCILPSLKPMQFVYMEVDTKKYEALGNSNDWEMQCVKSDAPEQGALSETESKSESPYKVDYLSGKDMMLHCGNSEGINECASGSNSSRSGAWKKKLDASGKTMLSVYATPSMLAPQSGEKLYCQYFNKKKNQSLFAFEYLRVRK